MARALLLIPLLILSAGCTSVGGALHLNHATLSSPAFELSPASGDADTMFHVDSEGLGDKYNVTWDWGDGTTTYGGTSDHKYAFTNGVMTVSLVVTSTTGEQGFASHELTLGTGKNTNPVAYARATRSWIEVGQETNLTGSASDPDRDPITYAWSYLAPGGIAEKVVGTGDRMPIRFDAPGKYDVRVRASDPKGGQGYANETIVVSKKIPSPLLQMTFNGTIVAGDAGSGVSDKLWLAPQPVPDTNVDATRHHYKLLYPAYTVIFLTWNDTVANQTGGVATLSDLDLELRAANGTTVFKSQNHITPNTPPAPPTVPAAFEYNITRQPPGDYDIIVSGYAGANVPYTIYLQSSLQITPDLVAAAEGT